jgi:hypothetical protein
VAGDEDGPALRAQAPQELANLHDPRGIEAVGGSSRMSNAGP